MKVLTIERDDTKKGRDFSAVLLASFEARNDTLEGSHARRPIWAMFGGSDEELRPFLANLRLGRKLLGRPNSRGRDSDHTYEFLKSAPYQVSVQKETEGTIATVYLPDYFRLDPGMVDPNGISFGVLPSISWVETELARQSQAQLDDMTGPSLDLGYAIEPETVAAEESTWRASGKLKSWERHPASNGNTILVLDRLGLERLGIMARLFVAFLDRRTRAPIPTSAEFHLRLLLRCLREGLCTFPTRSLSNYNTNRGFGLHDNLGCRYEVTDGLDICSTPIWFRADHTHLEAILAEMVAESRPRRAARAENVEIATSAPCAETASAAE